MAGAIRVAILGAGKIAARHAQAFKAVGGYQISAIADLIPQRRRALAETLGSPTVIREVADANELLSDPGIDAFGICLPNHMHAPIATTLLKAGKHVVCETPPVLNAVEARRLSSVAARSGKVLLFAAQARFGPNERAARQAIDKGYAGEIRHVRAAWMRTRAIPVGASFAASGSIEPGAPGVGWYADKSRSGGGVLMDLGSQILDVAYDLLGRPRPMSVFATTSSQFMQSAVPVPEPVEDTVFALVRFEGGKTLELSASWAVNQPPHQNGKLCRLYGEAGAIDLYTRQGPVLYRDYSANGDARETLMKLPKVAPYPAMMRHFRECIQGKATPLAGADYGLALMQMIDAIYKSAATGKSAEVR
jgi:predicted dehydrogenase